jgi:hypothetical protein
MVGVWAGVWACATPAPSAAATDSRNAFILLKRGIKGMLAKQISFSEAVMNSFLKFNYSCSKQTKTLINYIYFCLHCAKGQSLHVFNMLTTKIKATAPAASAA